MVIEENLTLSGGHTINIQMMCHRTIHIHETYVILLTNVTKKILIKKISYIG